MLLLYFLDYNPHSNFQQLISGKKCVLYASKYSYCKYIHFWHFWKIHASYLQKTPRQNFSAMYNLRWMQIERISNWLKTDTWTFQVTGFFWSVHILKHTQLSSSKDFTFIVLWYLSLKKISFPEFYHYYCILLLNRELRLFGFLHPVHFLP